MDNETKTSLDNVIKKLQGAICIEYNKTGAPNKQKTLGYLAAIHLVNEEFKTQYSIDIKKYDITKLPLED